MGALKGLYSNGPGETQPRALHLHRVELKALYTHY